MIGTELEIKSFDDMYVSKGKLYVKGEYIKWVIFLKDKYVDFLNDNGSVLKIESNNTDNIKKMVFFLSVKLIPFSIENEETLTEELEYLVTRNIKRATSTFRAMAFVDINSAFSLNKIHEYEKTYSK